MRGIFRRTVAPGPQRTEIRCVNFVIQKRARLLAIVMVMSLLTASLPLSSAVTAKSQSNRPFILDEDNSSLPGRLYESLATTFTSLGAWLAAGLGPRPTRSTGILHSVAAYIPPPPVLDPPTNLQVTEVANNHINLSWTAPAGTVAFYQVERSPSIGVAFQLLATVPSGTTYIDQSVEALHAYLYRVRAFAPGGLPSLPSNMALGTAIEFEFNELDNQLVRARHFHDVRKAVDLVRGAAGISPEDWDRDDLTGLDVLATDLTEIRTALNLALNELHIPIPSYQDPTLTAGETYIHSTHIEQLQTASTRGSSTIAGPIDSDSTSARLDPLNETGGGGENPLSRNFNWNLPLVNLPGRAGLNLGLTLSYNSLVWTKIGTAAISFDDDKGWPSPGFRLGFPVIQQAYFNNEVGKHAFLLIEGDGSRTELRQVPDTTLFESADSSYLQFDSSTRILRATDGTQLTFEAMGQGYNCTKIKDRNGNYIDINYNSSGRIDTVIDTLGRTIEFKYVDGLLDKITQVWKEDSPDEETHTWADFDYTDTEIQTNFPDFTVVGPANDDEIKTLSSVILADGEHFDFSYTSWGQVWKVSHFSGGHLINHRAYNLPGSELQATGPQLDCPRFTERHDWAQYWNGDTNGTADSAEEAITEFEVPVEDTMWTFPGSEVEQTGVRAEVTFPDNTSNKIYFLGTAGSATGWRRSLSALINTYDSGGNLRRQVETVWTQDDEGVAFKLNPRVKETKNFDPQGNETRTEIQYEEFDLGNNTKCHLPSVVYEYPDADPMTTTKLRSTRTQYNMSTTYKNKRILGLVSQVQVFEGALDTVLRSQVGFGYDEGTIDTTGAPIKHDNENYPPGFTTRGNLTSVTRYNVNNTQQSTVTTSKYNRAGSVVSKEDASGHDVLFSYADAFSDGTPRSTFAYPTVVTDPEEAITTAKYNFDFGATTESQTPLPNEAEYTAGPIKYFTYDEIGRLVQLTNSVNGASIRTEYHLDQNRIDTFTKIEDSGEAQSFEILDGHGRVVGRAKTHPSASTENAWSGQQLVYDQMGRIFKTYNPIETLASGAPAEWIPVGDDLNAIWRFTQQTYDWKGRPLVTTHQNGATRTASYTGCGCAGGQIVTLTDEGGFDLSTTQFRKRQQKIYSDVLGRARKTEILNWENGSVYSTTVNSFNARNQVTEVKEYVGPEGGQTFQVTSLNYDGYGRLQSKHIPQQLDGTNTVWSYNDDDTVHSITDARGASQTFVYNDRHQVLSITYAGVSPGTATVSYEYDAAGNRTLMTDGFGDHSYHYDDLSRLTTETRNFSVGSFSINYSYNLAGQLSGLTDPFGDSFTYVRNVQGQLKSMTGSPYAGVSNYISNVAYRAWGAPKTVTFAGGHAATTTYNSRMQPSTYRHLTTGGGSIMREDYGYDPDGRIGVVVDLDDTVGSNPPATARFLSRNFSYDHVGRITSSGKFVGGLGSVPYSQSYGYDAFGNMTSRTGSYYNYNFAPAATDTATYLKNRRVGWAHNNEGQVTVTPSTPTDRPRTMTYDAAGRRVTSVETGDGSTISYSASYDGDGRLSFESTTTTFGTFSQSNSSFIVRSTVLGGEVLTRLNGAGSKVITHVPAEGLLFATQNSSGGPGPFVRPTHRNPLGISETNRGLYDPLGNFIPFRAAPDPRPPAGSYNSGSMSGLAASQANPDSYAVGCVMDGIPTPCNKVAQAMNRLPVQSASIHGFAMDPWLLRLMASFQQVETKREVTEERSVPPSETKYDDEGNAYDFIGLPPRTVTRITMEWVIAPGTQRGFEQNFGPQEPSKPSHDRGSRSPNPFPGCITGRWLLNNPEIQSVFNDVWQQTAKSGKENGGWIFYEPKTNTIHINFASEGTDRSMPNEKTEFANQTRQYQQEGRSVLFIGMFHSHPDGSKYPSSVLGDMDILGGRNNVRTKGGRSPVGFIIYGSGKITPYDQNGVLFDVNSRNENGVETNEMTRCL